MNQQASNRLMRILSSNAALVVYSGLLCFILGMLCILLAQYTQYASIWVVNAVLLIFIFRSDPSLTKWYYLIGLLVNFIVNVLVGAPVHIAFAISLCNSLEILLPVLCVPREKGRQYYIKGFNHQTNMLVISIPIGCLLSALFTSLITFVTWPEAAPKSPVLSRMVFNWFAIDLLAMMAILPLGLAATNERFRKLMRPGKLLELIFMLFTAAAFTWLSTTYTEIRFVIILMPLLYASFRLGIFGTALMFLVIVTVYIINIMVTESINPHFVDMSQWISYSFVLMCITLVPALIISILIDQRDDFEQKLSEDEQRFRGAIQYSAIGMALVSPNGNWMVVNPALCEITGYSEEELMQLRFQDITHPEDLARDIALMRQLAKQEIPSYTLEKRYIKKGGDFVWISLVVSAVFDQKKRVVYYITQVENITMRKRMEAALQESEQRWNFALEGGSQGVWDWDLASDRIYYSRTWKMILGYQENEITSSLNEWMSRIHPDDEAVITHDLNQHITGATHHFHREHRIRCKDGSYKWFLGRGKVIARSASGTGTRVIGTITDIDAIKKSEAETERLSRRLQMALDAGQIGIFNYDIANNTLIWDKRMYELYGTTPQKFSHHFDAWKKRIHPEDLPQTYQILMRALDEVTTFDAEFRVIHDDKSVHWIRAKAQVLGDNNKKALAMLGMNWDITGEKQMVHDLFTEKERLSTTLKAIGDAVIVSDADGIISFINPIAEQLIGCSSQTAVGKRLYDICKIVSETNGELIESPIEACLNQRSTSNTKEEGILINHVEARYYIQDSASAIILPSGEIAGCVLVMQDVTMNRKLQTELKHQATHDVLTGLINRREIELKLKSLIADTRTIKNINSLFFIDLDNFKIVNDTAGHAAGDELLRRVAEILIKSVRTTDVVARLGGDEFAILLPECHANNAINIANNIIKKVSSYNFIWDNKSYSIGASIGLVTFRSNDISLEEVLSRADIACYTAKNQSGNKVSVFEGTDSDASKLLNEIQLGPKIVQALQDNSFLLYAQKISPLQSSQHFTPIYEVLLRMQDDNGNLIMPGAFLKSAERQHMITDIDEWVVKQILIEHAAEIKAGNFNISVNLSTKSTNSLQFHKVLDEYLNLTKLDKAKLGFELTEAAFSNDPESAQAFLHLMEKHGCFISIDNFGKGLRSFQYFKKFEDIYVKIDGELIHGIDCNAIGYAIVDSVNQLAHKLGAKTIAQFVETDSLIHTTTKLGIDYAQGFAVSKPAPLKDILTQSKPNHTHRD